MEKEEVKAKARELYALASKCNVAMLRACRRIGMASSTPWRWLTYGSQPGEPDMMARLRASILRCAAERGTLPDAYRADYEALADEGNGRRRPLELLRDIRRTTAELEKHFEAEGMADAD